MTTERIDIIITEKGGKVVKRSIEDIGESAKKVDADIAKFHKGALVAGAAVGAVLGGAAVMLYKGFKNAAESIEDTYKASKKLGLTTEVFSQLEFAARSYDVTAGELTTTIQQLELTQAKAAKGTTDQAKLFDQLGISATNADGSLRPTLDVLNDLADIFQRMPEGTNKSTLSLKLFGIENQKMVELLSQGSAGLAELARRADEMGYTLSGETSKSVHAFYDELTDVKLQIEAMYRQALPGLLPLLQEFSGLLNSQEFKDGFNTIIQGSAQAIIWLSRLATTTANVTKFLGEEVAARVGGAELTDTARIEDRIERLQTTMKAVKDADIVRAPLAIMKASELDITDLLKTKDKVLARLQGELNKEESRLKIGTKLNEDAAMGAAERARKLAENALTEPPLEAPTIDWGALGSDKKGNGPKKVKDEIAALQRELDSLLSSINPVYGAELRLADAQNTLTKAVSAGLIPQDQANEYMKQYAYLLRDQLDPLAAVNRGLQEQMEIAELLGDERDREIQVRNIVNELQRQGIQVTDEYTQSLREQLGVLQQIDALSAAKERILSRSQGAQNASFATEIEALRQLLEAGADNGGISKQDGFAAANYLFNGAFEQSQQYYDSLVAQREIYYAQIDELRQLDVINDQTAQQAKLAFANRIRDIEYNAASAVFGELAKLSSSHNKTLARIGKAAAITDATIKGVQAVQNALANVPYPYNYAAAAAITVTTAANVASIASQPLPAFRTGGSMVVGGTGGTDSEVVALRATPGERIDINTPAQARAKEQGSEPRTPVKISMINVVDKSLVHDYMNTDEGTELVWNIIESNPERLPPSSGNY